MDTDDAETYEALLRAAKSGEPMFVDDDGEWEEAVELLVDAWDSRMPEQHRGGGYQYLEVGEHVWAMWWLVIKVADYNLPVRPGEALLLRTVLRWVVGDELSDALVEAEKLAGFSDSDKRPCLE